jgi:hypothetical protein
MSDNELNQVTGSPAPLTLDLAMVRYSVVCERWGDKIGDAPYLTAFIAGWCCRSVGMPWLSNSEIGAYPASYRAGWAEADDFAKIWHRENTERRRDEGVA